MKQIRELLTLDIEDPYNLYIYGLYTATVVYQIKNESIAKLNKLYKDLPIQLSKEIALNGKEIAQILNKEPGNYLKEISKDLEKQIIYNKISNNKEDLEEYIIEKYHQ